MHIRLPAGMDRAGVAVISVMVCASCTACRLRWHVLAHGTTWVLVFASFRESGKKGLSVFAHWMSQAHVMWCGELGYVHRGVGAILTGSRASGDSVCVIVCEIV